MEALLGRLTDAMNVSPTEAQNVYNEIANSKYRQALMEVFVERKEFIRAQLDPTFYETQPPSNQINQMLRVLDNPVLPISPEDEMDEETEKLREMYLEKMSELRSLLYSSLLELQQGCEHMKADFCRVLKSQQMLRPIDHQGIARRLVEVQKKDAVIMVNCSIALPKLREKSVDLSRAVESIRRKQEITEIETKKTIANSVMLFQTRVAEATRRRRNFSKEAIAILQEYYDNHLAHPYPSEEEKTMLAEKCHISVQQVANWFGNRRIRTKKTQRQLFSNADQNDAYVHNHSELALNHEKYKPNNQSFSTTDSAASYKYTP